MERGKGCNNSKMKRKRVTTIAILAVVIVFAVGGFLIPRLISQFFYPVAPTMPAVVESQMEEILTNLEKQIVTKAPHVLEEMQPGLSAEEITILEQKFGVHLSADVKALYRWHNGSRSFSGPIPGHKFMPLDETLGLSSVSEKQLGKANSIQRSAFSIFAGHRKSWIALFDDGAGDGYFFDPKRPPSKGSIFNHFSEDSSYVFFPSLGNLMSGILKCYQEDAFTWNSKESRLDEDFDRSTKIWLEHGTSDVQ
jgi:cell wall assembly regulator SMI1